MPYPGFQPAGAKPPPTGIGVERVRSFDSAAFEQAVTSMLEAAGFDPQSEHLRASARCAREVWQNRLLDGYETDPATALGSGFTDPRRDMVVMRGITVHGMCPHHLLPFRGVAHIGYLPGSRLFGFGGLTRLVDAVCHRFIYQEHATDAVARALMQHGDARGAACVIEAEQLCLLLGEVRRSR
jgi:GTP cyclohydrolase I